MSETKTDPANLDAFVTGGQKGLVGKAVVQYNIIFDNEQQLKNFQRFIKGLKVMHFDKRTIAARMDAYLTENVIRTPEWDALVAKGPSAGKVPHMEKPTLE